MARSKPSICARMSRFSVTRKVERNRTFLLRSEDYIPSGVTVYFHRVCYGAEASYVHRALISLRSALPAMLPVTSVTGRNAPSRVTQHAAVTPVTQPYKGVLRVTLFGLLPPWEFDLVPMPPFCFRGGTAAPTHFATHTRGRFHAACLAVGGCSNGR